MFWPDPTHQIIHPPMGGEFFTDFKSSNRIDISISSSAIEFWLIPGVPPLGGWGWVDGGGTLSGFPYGGSHLHEIIMFIHVCMCACVRAYACTCTCAWGTPQTSWQSPTIIHPPPPPKGGTPRISQNSIALEQIKIFQFRLKILDLWRLVHSYRLHLVCSWGVSYHK